MKRLAAFTVLLLASLSAYAQEPKPKPKPCEELKAEIAKKLEANNVKSYSLDIVDKTKDAEGKVVGSCDGGTKKIVYTKTPQK
jgi:outer membrane lipoprotein-sorting protein